MSLAAGVPHDFSSGQVDEPTLKAGEPLTRNINGGAKQVFTINLAVGQYCRLLIQQRGIFLQVTLIDPAGKPVVVMGNPSGGNGPIYLSEIVAASGEYKLEVRSTENWANPGSVEVNIDELREAKPEDSRRVDAERLFAKAAKEDDARSFKDAVRHYMDALTNWQAIHDPHWEALTQFALAQTYRRAGDLKNEEASLTESLKIEVGENDWRIKASAINDLGYNNSRRGNNEKAIALLNESLQIYEAHHDTRGQASSLNNLSVTYGRMGDPRKALEYAERALPLRQADNFQSGVNNIRNTLGNIYDKLGDPYKSLQYFEQALAGWQELAKTTPLEPERLGNALNSLGIASEKVGNWDKARQYYEQAFAVPNILPALQASILNNQGDLFASFADFETALTYLGEARKRLDSLENPDPDVKASVLLELGQIQAATGNLAQALEYFQLAQKTQPNLPKLAYVLTALGDTWSRQGNLQEAMKAYTAALEIQLKIEDRRGQALTRQKLGEAYASSANPTAALKEFELSLELWRAVVDRRGEAATLNSLAYFERGRNDLRRALELSEQATNMLESLRTSVSSHQLRTSYFASHENFYELNIDLKMMSARNDPSGKFLTAALAASERSRARSLMDILSEPRADVAEGASDELLRLDREVRLKLGAKLDAQTLLLSRAHNEREAQTLAQEVSDLIRQQDELRGRIRSSRPGYLQLTQAQTLTLPEVQQQLDDETLLLEYALGDKRSYVWVVSRNAIKGFDLAGRDEIEAVAHQVTEALTARNLEPKGEDSSQKQLRLDQAERDYSASVAALSKQVLEPIAAELGQKRLVMVPDGALQTVPFAALPLPGSSVAGALGPARKPVGPTTLISEHEIVTLPSASVLALQRRELANRKPAALAVAILADPVFDNQDMRVAKAKNDGNQHRKDTAKSGPETSPVAKQSTQTAPSLPATQNSSASSPVNSSPAKTPVSPPSSVSSASSAATNENSALTSALRDIGQDANGKMRRLPRSREEARSIARAVPANQSFTALDFAASRETAISKNLANYRIIHFATHGVMDLAHPELSGIVLSMVNEKGEEQNGYLRLHEIYNLKLPAELVVLSACQTGVGKQIRGEGLIALTRGFMYAGARSVVASLWKVDDAATAALMAEFYQQMFTNHLKPAAALRAAQQKIAAQKLWQSPYFWAGFVLQGEWN